MMINLNFVSSWIKLCYFPLFILINNLKLLIFCCFFVQLPTPYTAFFFTAQYTRCWPTLNLFINFFCKIFCYFHFSITYQLIFI